MTSRRSFLRGLLALPALPAVPQLPADAPSCGGPIPGYGDGPIADTGAELVLEHEIHIDADVIRINGQELVEYVAQRLPQVIRQHGIKPL